MNRFSKFKKSISGVTKRAKTSAKDLGKKASATKAGDKTIRVNQNLVAKMKIKKDLRSRKRAEYLATLPKSRVRRFLYRLHPKRLARFWFSRDGAMMALKIAGIGILVTAIFIAGVFAYFRKDLPKNITDLRACSLGQTVKFYDRTKTVLLWNGAGDVDCRPVALSEISPYLQKAVIASEDKKFYSHHGFDPQGLINAGISNVKSGGEGRGGSTITQQYVKLSLLTSERSITRKIKELILAVELDASYKKDEILQAYLNEIGFAYQYNGAEAAARGLFDKSAKDLTLDEAATMSAGIPAPDFYWVQNQNALIQRRNYVLDQMVITGAIKKDEAEAAKKVDTLAKLSKNKNQYKDIKAPHFVLEVYDQLKEKYGKDFSKSGYTITTTLDMNLQKIAEESVANGFAKQYSLSNCFGIDCLGVFDNAALVSEDVDTGQVVAMVGSRDFNIPEYGQLNIATTPRSPGSSFKPYDYAALMASSQNWGAGSILYDLKTDFGGNYKPNDYDFHEPGGITMRYALGGSRNIPAIKAMYTAGINNTHALAIKMGMYDGVTGCAGAPTCDDILSTAIGDGGQVRLDQHVHAYATFSRLGKEVPQTYVLKIEDSKGKTISEWKPSEGTQAIDPQIAYTIDDMLSDRNASYFRSGKTYRDRVTNGFEALDVPAAMKTGTTNNFDNGWLMGFTTKYATGVWIGNHENKSSTGAGYENATGPIWGEFMRRATEALPTKPGKWAQPAGMKNVTMDSATYSILKSKCTGAQLGNVCGYGQTDIFPSWYSPKKGGSGVKATIDTISNRLATDCTPDLAKKEVISGDIQPEVSSSDPRYSAFLAPIVARYGGSAGVAIPTEKDNVHDCADAKPQVTLTVNPGAAGHYTLTADYTAGKNTLKTLNFKVDGQIVQSYDISANGTTNYDYTATVSGAKDVVAEVIDTVLYSASDTKNVTFAPAPVGDISLSANKNAGFCTFTWTSSVVGATGFDLYKDGSLFTAGVTSPKSGVACVGSPSAWIIKSTGVVVESNEVTK